MKQAASRSVDEVINCLVSQTHHQPGAEEAQGGGHVFLPKTKLLPIVNVPQNFMSL